MIHPDELAIISKPEVQKYIREKMGRPLVDFDCVWCNEHQRIESYLYQYDYLIVPDCISRDSERPERGLVGMIDLFESLDYEAGEWFCYIYSEERKSRFFDGKTPRLALLKALEWQKGRKARTH